MKTKLLPWILLVGLFVALTSGVRAQGSAPGRIVIAKLQGTVTLTEKATGATKSAVGVKSITEGWTVTTASNGSVVLVFSNGSTINVGKDSVLDIETFLQDPLQDDLKVADATEEPTTSTTKLNLKRGELVGNVKKLNKDKGSSFDVTTPAGAAGIRGTTFRIVFRPDPLNPSKMTFSVSTLEGEVVVSTASGTVNAPTTTTTAVTANKEIVVDVDVTIDPVSGKITINGPIPTVATSDLPNLTQAAINEVVVDIVKEAETAVFTPPPAGSNNATGETNTVRDAPKETDTGSSNAQKQQQTTRGDGV